MPSETAATSSWLGTLPKTLTRTFSVSKSLGWIRSLDWDRSACPYTCYRTE